MVTRQERKDAMRTISHPRLPKAKLISFGWSWGWFHFSRTRIANAVMYKIGWLEVWCRAPWLEHSARINHPHLFSDTSSTPAMGGSASVRGSAHR